MASTHLPLLVIDHHELIGTAMTIALRERGYAAHRCPVEDKAQILGAAAELPPGIVLLDLDLGLDPRGRALEGSDLIGDLAADGWRVLALTGLVDQAKLAAAVTAGASGIVSKWSALDGFCALIDDTVAGRTLISADERRGWAKQHRHNEMIADRLALLTTRERQILDDLAGGRRAAAIAAAAGVSVTTVRTHIRAVLAKLRVGSQLEAVALLRERSAAR